MDSLLIVFALLVALIIFMMILLSITKAADRNKAKKLDGFLKLVDLYGKRDDLRSIINNKYNHYELLARGLEFVAIPAKRVGDHYEPKYSRKIAMMACRDKDNIEFLILTNIVLKSLLNEKYSRYFDAANSDDRSTYVLSYEISNMYNAIKENLISDPEFTLPVFEYLLWQTSFRACTEVKGLFENALNAEVDKVKGRNVNLDNYKYVKDPDEVKYNNIEGAVELLYRGDNGFNTNWIVNALSCYEYVDKQLDPVLFAEIYKENDSFVKETINKIDQFDQIRRLSSKGFNTGYYRIEKTFSMNPYEFENLIARLFNQMGYDASSTKKSGDQGVDVIAKKGLNTIAIQTKCYPNTVVGNSAIQEVVAGMGYYKANSACVITNSTFTRSAVELANANNVELWDRVKLGEMLEKYPVYLS